MRRGVAQLFLLGAVLVVAVPTAVAAVTVTRAELSGTRLRVEGIASPNRTITVNGVAVGTSDASGNFRIERDPFAAPSDCKVAVNDGSATATTATLSGCTPSSTSPPPPSSTSATLSSLKVNPTDVVGGDTSTGTVTLTAPAPAGGFQVPLSNDNPTAANVPASVTVPAGATSTTFTITTNSVSNSQSATIVATTTVYAILTVWTPFAFSNGSIAIVPGGNGSGTVTSQPTGINCTITNGNGSGACTAFFPVGTIVRLDARPAPGSSFQGWRGLPGCADPSKIKVARGTTINCQPGFSLK